MSQVRVTVEPSYDPYARSIAAMAEEQFPGTVAKDCSAAFEATVSEIIGTKQHRYGPTPDPESLVVIRDIVRTAMRDSLPVPILIPWGASKQGPWGVDIAEVMALKQLACLSSRVTARYPPGIDARVRLEDLTDDLFFADVEGWWKKTACYVDQLQQLHRSFCPFSTLVLESSVMNRGVFRRQMLRNSNAVHEALELPPAERVEFLRKFLPEWRGDLPESQVTYYRKVYGRFYPDDSEEKINERLCEYFGSALARFQLDGTGATWDRYLTLSFIEDRFGRLPGRIYYRTIPERYTNCHKAPWIGKGYVRINGRTATPAISGFSGDGLDYAPANLVVDGDGGKTTVSADYVVVS